MPVRSVAAQGCAVLDPLAAPTAAWTSTWARSFGGASYDYPNDILPLADGGSVVVGYSASVGQGTDAWAMQLDRSGTPVWQKSYGSSAWDEWRDIAAMPAGGYIAVGNTKSYGAGDYDVWVVRLSANGDILWQRAYGGNAADFAAIAVPTSSGFYVIGTTASATTGWTRLWVIKLDDAGGISWQKVYGGSEYASDAVAAADGGLWVVEQSGTSGGFLSTVLLRLDPAGNVLWQKAYVGDNNSIFTPTSLSLTIDGGAVIAGYAGTYPSNIYDAWVLKVNGSGDVQWQYTFGGAEDDWAKAIVPFGSEGYRLVGYTKSYGSNGQDVWVLSLNATGSLVRQVALGGPGNEDAYGGAALAPDYSLLVGGYTGSFSAGSNDAWILKLSPEGLPGADCGLSTTTTAVGVSGVAAAHVSTLPTASATLGSVATSSAATDIALTAATQCQGAELAPVLFLPALQH